MQVSLYWSVVNLWLKTLPIRKHDIFFTRTKGQTNNYTHTQWNSYFTRKACSITRCSGARREVYCMPRYGQNLNNLDTLIGTEPIIFFLTSAASNFFFFTPRRGTPREEVAPKLLFEHLWNQGIPFPYLPIPLLLYLSLVLALPILCLLLHIEIFFPSTVFCSPYISSYLRGRQSCDLQQLRWIYPFFKLQEIP